MRRQCLFDSNHMIDEYGFNKHLIDCRSKLKKDWRMCRYDDSHWHLYHQIEFHEKYECPMNPLRIQNPKEFQLRRQLQLRKIQDDLEKNTHSKMDSFLSELRHESSQELELSFCPKSIEDQINFGEISFIQGNINANHQTSKIAQSKAIQNHSIMDLHEALNIGLNPKTSKNHSEMNQSIDSMASKNNQKSVCSKDQEMFQKGIAQNKNRWQEPDIEEFVADFRRTWQGKNHQENAKKIQIEQKIGERSFEEESDDLELSLEEISTKYNDIDYD